MAVDKTNFVSKRLTKMPCNQSTAGTYTLRCTVDAQGNKTYSWVGGVIDVIKQSMSNNGSTYTISDFFNKYTTMEIYCANNDTIYNYYRVVIANVAAQYIDIVEKIEISAVNVRLTFAKSGNDLVITNLGNWGCKLTILLA